MVALSSSTSVAALNAVNEDLDFETKNGLIISAVFRGSGTPDQIADAAGLAPLYVRPRLTALKELGLVEQGVRSNRTHSGRAAWTQELKPELAEFFSEARSDDELLDAAIGIFREARACYEEEEREVARDMMMEMHDAS